jgi:hypothetical protein
MIDRIHQSVRPRLHVVRDPCLELPPPPRVVRRRLALRAALVVALAMLLAAGLTWAALEVFG